MERSFTAALGPEEEEELAQHLNQCAVCRRLALALSQPAALQDDLYQAQRIWDDTTVDVSVPAALLNKLLPDYEIIGEIGRGGMGIVYRARQLKLNRTVALKVLPALLSAVRPDAMSRFKREAESTARLKHTNIISIHDFGEVDGTLFYTMEFIEGRSLRDVLQEIQKTGTIDVVAGSPTASGECGPAQPSAAGPTQSTIQSPKSKTSLARIGSSSAAARAYYRRVAGWIADVAEAIDYAHEQGVIHRDIKPSNLLLASSGRLMVTDFGLAMASGAETVTASRTLLGTARYMSPEQVTDSEPDLDRRVDVYGLGATLYELLALRPMFAAADDREVLDCVLNKEPAPPRRFVKQVPRELETICLKTVEKDRNRRYATAKDLADDLRHWLLDLPICARRPTRLVRVAKFVRRRKLPVAAVALSVALTIVASVLYVGYRGSQREASKVRLIAHSQQVRLLAFEAQSDFLEGRYDAALAQVNEVLAEQPDMVDVRMLRARILWRMRRSREAVDFLNDIVAADPQYWPAHYALADMCKRTDCDKADEHRRKFEQLMPNTAESYYLRACCETAAQRAINLLDKAIELDAGRFEFVMARGIRYGELQQYHEMLTDAERAVSMRPAWSTAHGLRGAALRELGRYEGAWAAFSRAIELEPHCAAWWNNRADVLLDGLDRPAEALSDANEAIRLAPEAGAPHCIRGLARARLGDVDGGLASIDRVIELRATAPALIARTVVNAQAGRWVDAVADSTRAIELDPENPQGYNNRALAYTKLGQYEKTIADLDRLAELRPNNATVFAVRATSYFYMGRYDAAIADWTRTLQLDPNDAESWKNRGVVHALSGDMDAAIADFTRLIELEPGQHESVLLRSRICLWKGAWEAAIADLTQVLKMDTDGSITPEVLLRRGMAYELAGAVEAALADYARATALDGLQGDYAILWTHVLLQQNSQPDAVGALIEARDAGEFGGGWIGRLFDLFAGKLAPNDLLASAPTDDVRAEAYYYIGRKALLDGKPVAARDAFDRCVTLGRNDIFEADFARALLSRLDEEGQPSTGMP